MSNKNLTKYNYIFLTGSTGWAGYCHTINPSKEYVIPAAAKRRAGIQQKPRYYWIPTFAGMTGW
ncbi:hypothetical protein D1BOALGB6SA_4963 [Olavius sp. associated proteobacterium Delta 1]|nr:hypothetical protein D1BOALGB6SA_4963 [Olavius sp. associated proteobacterium Delta 1]